MSKETRYVAYAEYGPKGGRVLYAQGMFKTSTAASTFLSRKINDISKYGDVKVRKRIIKKVML